MESRSENMGDIADLEVAIGCSVVTLLDPHFSPIWSEVTDLLEAHCCEHSANLGRFRVKLRCEIPRSAYSCSIYSRVFDLWLDAI